MKTYIIAEVGVNHNGDPNLAKEMIIAAKQAGADCVKFQVFQASQIAKINSPKAKYQLENTNHNESQLEMLKKLELDFPNFQVIFNFCQLNKIDFLATPYNFEDVDLLISLGVNSIKIASGQLTEKVFLEYIAKTNLKTYISTGMSYLSDVAIACEIFNRLSATKPTLLQCNTNYPTNISEAHIRVLTTFKHAFGMPVGYSDHVRENYASFAAVALGAEVIEKHFTLDNNLPGPDQSSSLTPPEFKNLVEGIRKIELALGDPLKKPNKSEIANMFAMKRSLVAAQNLKKGHVLQEKDFGFKRPQDGLHVDFLPYFIGQKLKKDISIDHLFQFSDVEEE